MTIALLCPNGHRLLCPEQQAGKRGKCPQCGATFRVPELSSVPAGGGSSPQLAAGGSAPRNVPIPLDSSPGSTTGSAPSLLDIEEPAVPENPIKPYNDGDAVGEHEVVFLCPEGHHLSGATSLGGKPGECPVCHTKFIVPSEEDLSEPEAPAVAPSPLPFNFDLGGPPTNGQQEAPEEAAATSPLAELFESFWSYKAQGAVIELHLGQGKVLAPDGYASHLSHHQHGVFMIREPNGLHTLAAVRWDSVSHITVRGLQRAPEGVFDEGR
ncbi:MAG TPA: hypothetical protein VG433_06125 [Pirellulales bacterium]|jgi:hypothetical protein|nr:hypothetical protein [Pirellulales bacterium]